MSLLSPSSLFRPDDELQERRPPTRRSWKQKFQEALRGVKLGIRGQSSFFVHFFIAAVVIVAAVVLRCSLVEWCMLIGCIGFVLVAELLNSAIETLFRGLEADGRRAAWPCLDIAAGAVLVASVTAAVVGTIVFAGRLWFLFSSAT